MKKALALFLALLLLAALPASATISTTQNVTVSQGNGATQVFSFPFVADQASDLVVTYTNTSGVSTVLSPSTYSVYLNPQNTGSLWSQGGSITYPLSGSPIPSGSSLTIQRILPLQQNTVISNQGNFYPDNVETAIDQAVMQIQQVSARTGSFRGVWQTNTVYNYGDIAQDGINGLNSSNYYLCILSNTSATWTSDLANGDWQLIIPSTLPAASFPLSIANGGTGSATAAGALTNLGGISLAGTNTFSGANSFTGGSITVPTRGASDSSTNAASTAFVNGTALTLANGTTAVTQSANDNTTKVATTAYVDKAPVGMIYLATVNASNSASVVFGSSYITSTYNKYVIEFDSMQPGTDSVQMEFQVSTNNGGTWITSGYEWSAYYDSVLAGSPGSAVDGSVTQPGVLFGGSSTSSSAANQTLGMASNNAAQGRFSFSNPSSTGNHLVVTYDGTYWGTATHGFLVNTRGGGTYPGGVGAYNAIRLIMTSGNINGNFHLYGLK